MALLDDVLKGWGGMALGVVVGAVAAPAVAGATGTTLRPLAKAAIKGVLAVTDGVREIVAEAREQVSDMVAEINAERQEEGPRESASAPH
jgi:Protein of unknown function (DUF5132)